MDDIKTLIEEQLNKIDSSDQEKDNIQEMINQIIKKENKKADKNIEYRRKLFEILEKLEKMNIKCKYNDKMTNEELEKIIK